MARILAVLGTTVSIGGVTAATANLTQFTGDTYVEIDGVKNVGSFGDSRQLITSDQVGSGRTKKAPGTSNAGTLELTCDRVPADPGQIDMIEASKSNDRFNFKIEVPVGGVKFETHYVTGYVMGDPKNFGGPNSVQECAFTIELDEAPLMVAPT